jgi:hypothetical protein
MFLCLRSPRFDVPAMSIQQEVPTKGFVIARAVPRHFQDVPWDCESSWFKSLEILLASKIRKNDTNNVAMESFAIAFTRLQFLMPSLGTFDMFVKFWNRRIELKPDSRCAILVCLLVPSKRTRDHKRETNPKCKREDPEFASVHLPSLAVLRDNAYE